MGSTLHREHFPRGRPRKYLKGRPGPAFDASDSSDADADLADRDTFDDTSKRVRADADDRARARHDIDTDHIAPEEDEFGYGLGEDYEDYEEWVEHDRGEH